MDEHLRIPGGRQRSIYYHPKNEFLSTGNSFVNHARSKLLYNELAPFYELATTRDTDRECRFIHDVIQRYRPESRSILDLGCGVGRHAGLLNREYEYIVTGVDISTKCLAQARNKYPNCTFFVDDIRHFCPKAQCDVAICMWSTFSYLSLPEDLRQFFRSVYDALLCDGLLIIDISNYQIADAETYSREVENGSHRLNIKIKKEVENGINEAIYQYEIINLSTHQVLLVTDQELSRVYSAEDVEASGKSFFISLDRYGDYDIRNGFDPNKSNRIIVVFRKRRANTCN